MCVSQKITRAYNPRDFLICFDIRSLLELYIRWHTRFEQAIFIWDFDLDSIHGSFTPVFGLDIAGCKLCFTGNKLHSTYKCLFWERINTN